jgi:uncharacterized membrane protein
MIWKIAGVLIVIWLAFTVIGVVVKGLFWLAIIGGLLFLGTAAYTAIKGGQQNRQIRS